MRGGDSSHWPPSAATTMMRRGHPGARAPADLAGENDHRHDEQQQIRGNVVQRQADGRDGESESGSPAPPGPGALAAAAGGAPSRGDIIKVPMQRSRACPNRPLRSMPIWLKSTPRTENRLFSGLCTVIRVGIVGCNYGRTVQLPAFRADPRCEVMALAGSNAARTAELARAADVPNAYGDWRALVEDPAVEAVAIATMPALQAPIALSALELGKPVFAEKPMASTLDDARAMLRQAERGRLPTVIDFNFHQVASWQHAKSMLDDGAIGALRHVAVHWHVENRAIQMRMRNWKTLSDDGGGVLGNFISHCFHYLEWFCGPIASLTARLSGLPGDNDLQISAMMVIEFAAGQLASLSMSCASYLGSGHRIEFYGEDGTLVLDNPGGDYMRGFELIYGKRPAAALAPIPVDDPIDAQYPDGRIAPVSRLASRFFDAIEGGAPARPDFAAGYRVQQLIDAAQRSHRQGVAIEVAPAAAGEERRR